MQNSNFKALMEKWHLLPTYTEVSLFLILLSFVLILWSAPEFASWLWTSAFESENSVLMAVGVIAGALAVLYYAFNFRRGPQGFMRFFMLIFVIFTEVSVGLALASYNVTTASILNYILSGVNFLQAFLLFILFRTRAITEENILPDDAKPLQLLFGALLVGAIFAACHFYFRLAWQQTASILVTYSVVFNDLLFSFRRERRQE